MKNGTKDFQPVYKREMKTTKDGKLVMNERNYVPIPKEFANELVKAMKNNSVYEDIVVFDGQDYLPEDRYEIYKAAAKILKNR